MAKKRLLWQIYPAYLAIALAVLAVMSWYAARTAESVLLESAGQRLLAAAQAADEAIGSNIQGDAQDQWLPPARDAVRDVARASGARISVIAPTGDVVFDSEREPAEGENLSDRSDVRAALSGEPEPAPRLGTGAEKASLFVTRPVRRNGTVVAVVRVALPSSSVTRWPIPWAESFTKSFATSTCAVLPEGCSSATGRSRTT